MFVGVGTDATIHSVHGVAQPATAGAVAYFLGNQGSNISSGAVRVSPSIVCIVRFCGRCCGAVTMEFGLLDCLVLGGI